MAAPLEAILAKLLEPDSAVIQEATQNLKELFKDPAAFGALCQVLGTSQTPQIRQYAAVLLRRKIQKSKHWKALPEDIRQSIRDNILLLLVQEAEKSVRNSIAQIVAIVAKHDLPTNSWPQVFDFLISTTKDADISKRELGSFVLYTVCSVATEQLKPHLRSVLQLLTELVNDSPCREVPYYAVRSISELVFFLGEDEGRFVQTIIPRVLQIVRELAVPEEDKACEVLEMFDELLDTEVAIIVPHIRPFFEFCVEVAANTELGDSVRVKAMSFIGTLTKLKKKAVLKLKVVPTILQVLFNIMCNMSEEEDVEEEEEEEVESHTPGQYAPQVIDALALHLPPDKLVPEVMRLVEKGLTSDSAGHRKAAYISVAVIAEGCADYIMNKHLNAVLQCVCKGLNDADPYVRNAALFALGQFSEHLQPNISNFASELLPLLFQYLGRATQEAETNPKGLTKSYYALEMFIENLEKKILPYLPNLMEHLLSVLKSSPSLRAKELAISALGAAAVAAKEGLVPYFSELMSHFKVYLAAVDSEDMRKLQTQTIDTLSILARNIGEETFQPLCKECIQFGISLLENTDDPDVRRCVYSLFAAISNLLKGEMSEYMSKVVHYMLMSVKSNEGVTPHFKEEAEQVSVFDQNFQDEEDIGDDDEEEVVSRIEGISVENAYLDEKEDACVSLGELAVNCGAVFLPFLEECYKEVLSLVDYPAPGVKKGAITSLSQFCLCVHQVHAERDLPETRTALVSMLPVVTQKYLEIIKTDLDRTVVMSAVDALHDSLDKIGEPVLQEEGSANTILLMVKEIFTHKLKCQDQEDEDEEENEAEYDGMLIESAGDVLPVMARLLGGQQFLPFFTSFITDLLKRLKETSSTAEKSFAVGTLAETLEACGPGSAVFVDTLYPVFVRMIREEDDEVRSNAVYALGVLAMYGGEKMQNQYKDILKMLFDVLNKEQNGRVVDNIAAASCRLIMANKDQVPLEHVVPVIVQCLPLKEDMEEWTTISTCLLQLYSQGNEHVIKQVPQMLKAIAGILGSEEIKQDTQQLLAQFVQNVATTYEGLFQEVKTSLGPDLAGKLDMCVVMVNGSPTG